VDENGIIGGLKEGVVFPLALAQLALGLPVLGYVAVVPEVAPVGAAREDRDEVALVYASIVSFNNIAAYGLFIGNARLDGSDERVGVTPRIRAAAACVPAVQSEPTRASAGASMSKSVQNCWFTKRISRFSFS